ncbi:MAG: cell division protein FtsQ/DivIB [Undibacterium sp.]
MFGSKKNDRRELFQKAMLTRGKRALPRRIPAEKERAIPWATFSLWLAFGSVSGYILFFSPGLSVHTVNVGGESILPLVEYETYVDELIAGRYFGFIPKNNYFLIPARSIERGMYERYPKISQVSVTRKFPAEVNITLKEMPFLLRWCSGGPCYGQREGKWVFLPAADDPRYEAAELSVIDESALPVDVGDRAEVGAYFQTFNFFYQEFPRIITTSIARTAHTPSRHSGELALVTGEGWRIILAVDRSPESSLRALQVFLDDYAKGHPDREQLAQVDFRVEGKIFYSEQTDPASLENKKYTE